MNLQETIQANKEKDFKVMRKIAHEESDSKTREAMGKMNVNKIVRILTVNFNNIAVDILGNRSFDAKRIEGVLKDEKFVQFLIKSSMINRVYKIKNSKCTDFLVRFYFSILTYMDFMER